MSIGISQTQPLQLKPAITWHDIVMSIGISQTQPLQLKPVIIWYDESLLCIQKLTEASLV